MTLRAYLRVLTERWTLVALFVLASTGLAILITATTEKVYQADVQIFVASTDTAQPGTSFNGQAFAQNLVQSFASVISQPVVINGVRDDLHFSAAEIPDAQLKERITATARTGQSILDLHVQDSSPNRAAAIADSAARAFKIAAPELFPSRDGSAIVKLTVTDPATAPTSPIAPKPLLNISLGVLLGLLVGAAFAVARDVLDNRIKDVETVAKVAGKPAMGVIVDDAAAARHPIATRAGARNIRAENFRQLRANLQFANVDEHPRVIAITSSIPSEGKTMVAMNLASTLAEAGFTVCLVDADLRRPTVTKALGLPSPIGLTSVLIQQIDVADALQNAGSNLYVLGSGPTPPNPSEVLASSYVREIIRSLLEKVDYVVIDTAPLLPVADGSEVAALADGTLLVARHKLTTDAQVKRAVATLARVDAKLLGVVLNRIPNKRTGEYGYSYYRADQPQSAPAHAPAAGEVEGPKRSRLGRARAGAS